jgi:hypothetical protein
MPRVARTVGLSLSAALFSGNALAYRPFDSTDAEVAKLHDLELELGPVQYLQLSHDKFLLVPAVIANAGIFVDWELVLEGRNQVGLNPQPGESQVQLVGMALSLKNVMREGCLQDRTGISLATEFGALLPTTPEHGFGASAALIASQRWPIGTAHLNGGVALSRAHHADAFGGLIVEGPYEWTVRPVGEFFFENEVNVNATYSGLVGAIWRVSDNLSFDAAGRRGRAGDATLSEVRVGLTWSFGL